MRLGLVTCALLVVLLSGCSLPADESGQNEARSSEMESGNDTEASRSVASPWIGGQDDCIIAWNIHFVERGRLQEAVPAHLTVQSYGPQGLLTGGLFLVHVHCLGGDVFGPAVLLEDVDGSSASTTAWFYFLDLYGDSATAQWLATIGVPSETSVFNASVDGSLPMMVGGDGAGFEYAATVAYERTGGSDGRAFNETWATLWGNGLNTMLLEIQTPSVVDGQSTWSSPATSDAHQFSDALGNHQGLAVAMPSVSARINSTIMPLR